MTVWDGWDDWDGREDLELYRDGLVIYWRMVGMLVTVWTAGDVWMVCRYA